MASKEIGFDELTGLVRGHWKWILGLAFLSGLGVYVALSVLTPTFYSATARLLVFSLSEGQESTGGPVNLSLAESDSLLQRTNEVLVSQGVLPEGSTLVLGRDLTSRSVPPGPEKADSVILLLTAKATSPEDAATIANTWAREVVRESQNLPRSTAAETESLLAARLAPTRQQLEGLEAEKSAILNEIEKREEETSKQWDQRIADANKKSESDLADFHGETRRFLEEAAARQTSETFAVAAKLQEIVSVRAELAKTPRVVTLEKAASDEDLAEMILKEEDVSYFESQLVSQEVNMLYDQLSLKALGLESDLNGIAGERLASVSKTLSEMEKIQRERSVGLAALQGDTSLVIRSLRRQRNSALRALARERAEAAARLERNLKQLRDLESQLAGRLNSAIFTGLLEQASLVSLVSPAAPRQVALPRRRNTAAAIASLLGAMLGLTIALFRTPEGPPGSGDVGGSVADQA